MSFYSDPIYNIKTFGLMAFASSFGTATASGSVGHDLSAVTPLPKFTQRTKIHKIRMRVNTIPNAASTALKAHFLNGTDTFGTVVLTTATAGQWLDVTMIPAYATCADDVAPTIKTTGTSTASAAAQGVYDIWMETQQLWDTTT